jgi:hypothetical protein
VLALVGLEVVIVVVLLIVGVPWPALLASGAPAIAITLAALNPTVQELGRRQPKLSVGANGDSERPLGSSPPPWPVGIERVITNEVAEARRTTRRANSALTQMFVTGNPFARRPSEADYERAMENFEKEVSEFAKELREWLSEYVEAARAYAETFELGIAVANAASGAHAEAVNIALKLPETVVVAEGRPQLRMPPERPEYEPPRPEIIDPLRPSAHLPRIRSLGRAVVEEGRLRLSEPAWKVSKDGRQLESAVGDVHPDRAISVGEPLFLRAIGPGRHAIGWSAYTKSARRAAQGTISLEVGRGQTRPAFGRLHGITSYPDVPLIDEDGEVSKPPRNEDPPPRPEPSDADEGVMERLREANRFWEWRELGLDPAEDGPEKVEVREARMVSESG